MPAESPAPAGTASRLANPASLIKITLAGEKSVYRIGERAHLEVTSDTAGFLYLLAFGGNDVASCIFPNAQSTDNQIRPGTPRKFVVPVTGPPGRDLLVALVSTTRLEIGGKPRYTLDEVLAAVKQAEQGSPGSWQSAVLPLETTE